MGKRKTSEAKSAAKRQKVKDEATSMARKGNPFARPPSQYNIAVLRAVQPLLKVWRKENSIGTLERRNKFYGGLMKPKVLDYVIDLLSDRLAAVNLYDKAKSEGNMRPYHLALVDMFQCVSSPSSEEYAQLEKKFRWKNDKTGMEDLLRLKQMRVEQRQDNETTEGFLLDYEQVFSPGMDVEIFENEADETDSDASDSSDSVRFHADNEAPLENELDITEALRTDIKFRTHKQSVLSDPKLSKRQKDSLKTQFCPMIIECKKDKEVRAVYQDAGYACVEMKSNIEAGHYDPMYLPIFADQSYTYSILDVHAVVKMNNNKVDYKAYEESCLEKGVDPLSEDDLTARVRDGLGELQQWPDLESKVYPDGKYLVGDFYMEGEWYPLPSDDVNSPGARNFFEAMLRIAMGDRVLSWTCNDVRVSHNRMEFIRLTRRANGNPQGDRLCYLSEASDPELFDMAAHYFQKLNNVCLELKTRETERFTLHAQPGLQTVLEVLLALPGAQAQRRIS